MIAALYVDPRGPYPAIDGVDCWDRKRDARKYRGPHPVIAHPPCGAFSMSRHLGKNLDETCGPRAVRQVRRFGGVLEQPAHSLLWQRCKLPRPRTTQRDDAGGFSVEVEQVAWGHCARKRTWLYFVGVDARLVCQTIRTGGRVTHWVSGRRGNAHASANVPAGIRVCSAQSRNRTPPAFAEWLVMLARTANKRIST